MIGVPAVTGRPTPDVNAPPAEATTAPSTLASTRDAVDTIFVRVDATPSMWLYR